ncbi:MAG: hypothetical protein KGI38_12455 [Thaumarchaeota archaeon]|nr:hypothetical protein [Nitrososphaerota archaeon]
MISRACVGEGVELKCEYCGKAFVSGHVHRFCSVRCGVLAAHKELEDPAVEKALLDNAYKKTDRRSRAESWRPRE